MTNITGADSVDAAGGGHHRFPVAQRVRQQLRLGRPAQPAELAGAFVFPASPAATYITGAVIAVTGGEFYA